MNRIEFCNLMEQAKAESGVRYSDISFSMKMLSPVLWRFEKGKHNFSLTTVFEYLAIINCQLVIYNGSSDYKFKKYEKLLTWLVSKRKKVYSQQQLSEIISMSRTMIAKIETQKSNLTIDVFLKIIEVLGYELKIESL